jgi:c-di-GMP-binding flagellar brake protein YcgR
MPFCSQRKCDYCLKNSLKFLKEKQLMESVGSVEKRIYSRVPIDMDIEVSHLPGDNSNSNLTVISCRGRDVSEGGVSFLGQSRYASESLLRLIIPLCNSKLSEPTDDTTLLKVMGKVIWCKKNTATNSYVTGVQFLNIYEKDFHILNEYVQKLLIE